MKRNININKGREEGKREKQSARERERESAQNFLLLFLHLTFWKKSSHLARFCVVVVVVVVVLSIREKDVDFEKMRRE